MNREIDRELKFQFIIDDKHLSPAYTLDEILSIDEEKVFMDMEGECNCHLTESTPYCEGDCAKFENSKITGKRQFTGLKDSTGKEIYEGDIVSGLNLHMVVKFGSIRKGVDLGWVLTTELNTFNLVGLDQCTIIGDIYTTPELINKN